MCILSQAYSVACTCTDRAHSQNTINRYIFSSYSYYSHRLTDQMTVFSQSFPLSYIYKITFFFLSTSLPSTPNFYGPLLMQVPLYILIHTCLLGSHMVVRSMGVLFIHLSIENISHSRCCSRSHLNKHVRGEGLSVLWWRQTRRQMFMS